MTETRLILLRHGQAQVNVDARLSSAAPGSPLTEHGRAQARQAAARIGRGVEHVYASPLLRARQTGEIVAAELEVELTVLDALAEVGIGDLEGQPGSDDTVLHDPAFQAWQGGESLDRPLAGGETGAALVQRVAGVFDLVRERHAGGAAVVVSHGGLIAAAVPNLARGVPLDRARAQIPLNTAAVELVWTAGEWRCVSWPAVEPGRNAQRPGPPPRIVQRGLWFEEFVVGAVYEHRPGRTVTETDNVLFTTLTMNTQPLHLDAAASAEIGPYHERLVNSMFTLSTLVGLSVSQLTLGTIVANLGFSAIAFSAPVRPGDTLYAQTRVVDKRLSRSRPGEGVITLEHTAHNQHGTAVARATRQTLVRAAPVDAAADEPAEVWGQ